MSDVGKRPTKPGQMVMIVGSPRAENNGITGITRQRLAKGKRHSNGGRYDNPHWVCDFSKLPTTSLYRPDGTPINGTTAPSNCICEYNLIVIADPDIDVTETESLNLPEGVPA